MQPGPYKYCQHCGTPTFYDARACHRCGRTFYAAPVPKKNDWKKGGRTLGAIGALALGSNLFFGEPSQDRLLACVLGGLCLFSGLIISIMHTNPAGR